MREILHKSIAGFSWPEKIHREDFLFFAGSCFSEEIGTRCKREGIGALVNPGGTMFDPLSLERHFYRIMQAREYVEEDFFFHDGLYRNWDHYSKLGSSDKKETIQLLNRSYEDAHVALKHSRWLFITFGTAWYYRLREGQRPVCNCHKMPGNIFDKHLLSYEIMLEKWTKLLQELKSFNPQLNIVLTVSPVKHLRDGVIQNSRSKALLLNAVWQLCDGNFCRYFPSFELVNDVLRDYDFYKPDGAHPNEKACDFVYEFFKANLMV